MQLRRRAWRAARAALQIVRPQRPSQPGPYSRLSLVARQDGAVLNLTIAVASGLEVLDLSVRDEHGGRTPVGVFSRTGDHQYHAEVDLALLAERFATDDDEEFADVRLGLTMTSTQPHPPKFALLDDVKAAAAGRIRYWAPLGRFRHTELVGIAPITLADGRLATVRISTNGHVLVHVSDAPPRADAAIAARSAVMADGVLTVSGVIDAGFGPVATARLVLAGRGIPAAAESVDTEFAPDPERTARRHGRRQYSFTGSVDLRHLGDAGAAIPPHSTADLQMLITSGYGGDPVVRPVGDVPFAERQGLSESTVAVGDTVIEASPYLTFKTGNIALRLEQYDGDAYRALARPQRRGSQGDAPIWIVGERPHTAQDNGYHLFRYLRAERRDIDAYYVITADSPDRANLAGLDHVVTFGSREHMDLALRASRIVGTHHAEYLLPSQSKPMARAVSASRVFLQHGVMGTKWMVPNYGKFGTDFRTDLFCVSSERERELIVGDFGYRRDEVVVTGLARFDSLFADDVPMVDRFVLIAPTWRDWLGTEEKFLASDYLAQWRGLMTDPRLRALQAAGATVALYLHSNMQRYGEHFADCGVTVIEPGSVSLQHLLKQATVLITDYSSSAFDFSFLHRPVIYFQFDRDRFLGAVGSHLDLEEELPGQIAPTRSGVLDRLETVLAPGFELEEAYRQRATHFLAHRDRDNCERITAAIEALRPRRTLEDRARGSAFLQLLGTRFRKSKRYFGIMRRVFAAAKLLPTQNVIVFESDTGKRFSDSPREIYLELIRRGDPRPRVWIYDRTPPVVDPQRTVIKRYSPRYFLTLGRAKYWVSNQNLPYYITRRRRGVYLQTWHGTPLKKMQHDLAQIVGRDDGYLDRVTQAAAQWTALISPSPYATACFRSAFRYDREVLETGYPRNDVLAGPDAAARRTEIRARLGLREDQRVVLYAPTFRDDQKVGSSFTFSMPFDLERFVAENPDTVLLLRMHRLIATSMTIPRELEESVRDLSGYGEIADLYLAADCLIADYSSVIFDYAITGKPIIFFPYDLGRYRDDVRGFYLDYEAEMPGPIALTDEELYAAVRQSADPAAEADLRERVATFAERFAPWDDGHAAERVADAVFGKRR